ncbi:unnamed protein product [Gongylonema pulchrum]|uniref:DUF3179 domain-containing protein n=1 Tax=Gongylonema pulchrum TaxID=637853 RepID=A0A183EW44_9BILA|nr:unnamed protein product [Gongylonema pulchrum]
MLSVGEMNSGVAHVKREPVADARDTDNAWVENDVWAVFLGSRVPEPSVLSHNLSWIHWDSDILAMQDREYVSASFSFLDSAEQ